MKKLLLIVLIISSLFITNCATNKPSAKENNEQGIDNVVLQLSQQISSTMTEQNKKRVAVMNFPLITGETTDLSTYLSEKLINSLFKYREKFVVVERSDLNSVFKEIKLGTSGVIDDSTAQSVGKLIGADAIVIGKITDLGDDLDINVRMIGTEQANLIAVANSILRKNETVLRLLGSTAKNRLPSTEKKAEGTQKDERLEEFNSLINPDISIQHNKQNIALVIDSQKGKDKNPVESSLYNLLKTEKVNIIFNLFKEEQFKSKGFFNEIYDGNTELLKQPIDIFKKIDGFILGKISYSCQKNTEIDQILVSCRITFSYKSINRNGEVIRSDNVSVTGPGFSEDAALERGLEILSEKYSERILKINL